MSPATLILIDVQRGFDNPAWGKRNNPEAEKNMEALLSFWRARSWPVVHVRHCSRSPESPLHKSQPGNAYKPATAPLPEEPDFEKDVNSAFIGTDLETYLRDHKAQELVMAGLTTDHCVSTSVRMASNMGFDVVLPSDATATFDRKDAEGNTISADDMHRINLASLNGEFCRVKTTADILEQMAQ